MNITQEKVDELNAVLNVDVVAADYAESVNKTLKSHQKSAQLSGFRPGKVPFGLIKKKYGTAVKVEEINRLVGSKITAFISDEKLNILGQPLPVEDIVVDWENGEDFSLKYELGLSPEFDIKLSAKDKFTYYNVVPDEELINNYVEEITMRYGKVSNPEEAGEKDLVAVDIIEFDGDEVKEDGFAGMVTIALDRVTNEEVKKQLVGGKKDDKFFANIKEFCGTVEESAQLLNKQLEEIEGLGNVFQIEIGTISRMEAAELNQELFDKVYGEGTVKTVEEFREKVKEESQKMMGDQGKGKLKGDMIDYFLEKLKFDLPDAFMKRWLVLSSDQKLTAEQVEADYDNYQKSIKWQVIENKLIEENQLKVEGDEVVARAKEMIAANFRQYGQEVPDDQLEAYAQNILQKEEEKRRLYDDLYYDKIIDLLKEKCKVEEKEIGYQEFITLSTEK